MAGCDVPAVRNVSVKGCGDVARVPRFHQEDVAVAGRGAFLGHPPSERLQARGRKLDHAARQRRAQSGRSGPIKALHRLRDGARLHRHRSPAFQLSPTLELNPPELKPCVLSIAHRLDAADETAAVIVFTRRVESAARIARGERTLGAVFLPDDRRAVLNSSRGFEGTRRARRQGAPTASGSHEILRRRAFPKNRSFAGKNGATLGFVPLII